MSLIETILEHLIRYLTNFQEVTFLVEAKYHSVAASILSLPITIMGFSKLQLTAWWHFILAVIAILAVYFALFLAINIGVHLYEEYFQRANIEADEETELKQLNGYILRLYCLYTQYDQAKIECIKTILRDNISALYKEIMGKICFIERSIESPTLKHKFNIKKEAICNYKQLCDYIRNKSEL